MVDVGFTPPEVTQMLPSTMKRFFTSWQRPHSFTRNARVEAHPRGAQQVARAVQHGAGGRYFFAPAAARISDARAMPCSIICRVFSLIV